MLVLSRKRMEAIQIGDEIRITVIKIERNGVRLGIEAPRGIPIVREELLLDFDADAEEAGGLWDRSARQAMQPAS